MKRIICLIISLCLILGSFSFAFAEAWTNTDVYYLRQDVADVKNELLALGRAFYGSLGTMYNSVSEMMSWLSPQGNFGTGGTISGLTMYEILDYIAWNIDTDWNSEFAQLNALPSIQSSISSVNQALSNYYYMLNSMTPEEIRRNSHFSLINASGDWSMLYLPNSGGISTYTYSWTRGTPLGNLALMFKNFNNSFVYGFNNRWNADLLHYNDNLTTWDSQGNTLTQVAFTPQSAIQGLYRYLAFTQRDVARLAYAYASDEELEAREQAKANQEQIFDDFIDPSGDGSVSTTDLGDMAGISSGIKDNLDTGVSAGGIFDVFTGNHSDEWFSQATYNELMGIRSTRDVKSSGSDYSTPLLDQQMNDLLSLFGGDVVD